MTILPLTYLGNIEYISHLMAGDCMIDIGENYVKQTYRNRCDIMTANGRSSLTVNVMRGGSKTKVAVRDMRIDYSKRWQHQHSLALISAYKNSPFFDHYWNDIAPFFEKRFEFLADFNLQLLQLMLDHLGIEMPRVSQEYITPASMDCDLRGYFHSKGSIDTPKSKSGRDEINKIRESGGITGRGQIEQPDEIDCSGFTPYYQVFSDRFPFAPNLSVIDLLMCEGPASSALIAPVRSL